MEILKSFLMAFPAWLSYIFMVVGVAVTALFAVRLGYGAVIAKTAYKWIEWAEVNIVGGKMGAEKKKLVIDTLREITPDWLDWAINEKPLTGSWKSSSKSARRSWPRTWKRRTAKPPLWPASVRRGRTRRMTDEELEHRLTAVENRARSNTHRLNDLEKLTDAVNGMNTNIKLTIQQLENTNKSLEIVTAQNKKQDDRLTALEKAPGTFGNKLWWAVIAALVSGLVAYELTMLLH